jgi:hypothetical protein
MIRYCIFICIYFSALIAGEACTGEAVAYLCLNVEAVDFPQVVDVPSFLAVGCSQLASI